MARRAARARLARPTATAIDARRAAGQPVGRPHLAAGRVRRATASACERRRAWPSCSALLDAYLIPGCPAYRRRTIPTVPEAIDAHPRRRRRRGLGAPVLGPRRRPRGAATRSSASRGAGLDGVEVFYATHTREQTLLLDEPAAELGLLTTGSADFHGPDHRHFAASAPSSCTAHEPNLGPIAALALGRSAARAAREPSASSASSSLRLSCSDARVSSTRSCAGAQRARADAPRAASSRSCVERGRRCGRARARRRRRTRRRAATARRARGRGRAPPSARAAPRACRARPPRGACARGPWRSELELVVERALDRRRRACAPAARARSSSAIHGPAGDLAAQRAARDRLGAGAQRRPVAERERAARARRRRARAARRRRRRPARRRGAPAARRSRSTDGASKRTCWQREAIVGRTSPGRLVSRMRCANDGGSSSVLSIRLAAWSLSSSACSMTNTRRRASNGVRAAPATTGLVDVADEDPGRARGRDPGQVGVRAVLDARGRAGRVGRALGQQRGGERARDRALAAARRAREQVGVARRAAGRAAPRRGRRGRADGARCPGSISRERYRRGGARPAHHDRGDRRGRQDDAGRRAARRARARAAGRRCCASRAASRCPSASATLVKDPALRCDPRAEALLYAAARAQLVDERLRPLLDGGDVGAARPLRRLVARLPGRRRAGSGVEAVAALNDFAHRRPDARPHAAAARRPRHRRARARSGRDEAPDRLEREERGVLRRRSPPPTTSSRPPSRSASACSTPTTPPERVLALALDGAGAT